MGDPCKPAGVHVLHSPTVSMLTLFQGFESESESVLFLEAPLSHLRASRTVERSTVHWPFNRGMLRLRLDTFPAPKLKAKMLQPRLRIKSCFFSSCRIILTYVNYQKKEEKTQGPKSNCLASHCSWPSKTELMCMYMLLLSSTNINYNDSKRKLSVIWPLFLQSSVLQQNLWCRIHKPLKTALCPNEARLKHGQKLVLAGLVLKAWQCG